MTELKATDSGRVAAALTRLGGIVVALSLIAYFE